MSDQQRPSSPSRSRPDDQPDALPASHKPWRSEDLFGNSNQLVILHDGEEYRLRITQKNKLILTK